MKVALRKTHYRLAARAGCFDLADRHVHSVGAAFAIPSAFLPNTAFLRSVKIAFALVALLVLAIDHTATFAQDNNSGSASSNDDDASLQIDAHNDQLVFERDIRPILRAHCLDCHGAEKELQAGLDLRQVRLMRIGGDSGPALDSEQPHDSLLLQRIRSGEMPPGNSKVTPAELAKLEAWIDAGAPTARPESEMIEEGIGITPEERSWWAFQPLNKPTLPEIEDGRIRNPIDRFILSSLHRAQLDFSAPAGQRELAIRAWIDLTGLPPTPDELRSYLSDSAPDAYERLIDRLLDTEAYGERWGRHWLDVAGYSDSEGYTTADNVRPWAYFYRDYVIRSIRNDKPIDRFITEQLAGDELFAGDLSNPDLAELEPLIATGFLRMAADGTGQGGVDEAVARQQTVADTLKIVSSSLLGVTLACAQCHDHRYDPILQEDYYRLRAVFEPALDPNAWQPPPARLVSLYTQADRDQSAQIEQQAQAIAAEKNQKQAAFIAQALTKELEKFEEPLRSQLRAAYETAADARTEEQRALLDANPSVNISPGTLYQYNQAAADELKQFDERIAAVRATKPVERFIRVLREPANHLPITFVFHRGDYRQPTKQVAPGDLTVLASEGERIDFASDDLNLTTSGRRLSFAKHLTNGRHPLFNRVFVNRVWMNHFGQGIVETPAEFGRLGELPTHPELLDYLACELADSGWSLKHLHRLIMTSYTYRQTSQINPDYAAQDAQTSLYWRYPMRRLEAESIRDRILQCAGVLDLTSYGPAVGLKQDESGQVLPSEETRRSVYLQVRRTQPISFLQAFDLPIMETNCERRSLSTVAPQALMLLNSDFMRSQAQNMVARLAQEAPGGVSDAEARAHAIAWPSAAPRWSFGWADAPSIDQYQPQHFAHLPHWTGSAWQGGEQLPDAQLEWCTLNAAGGHPGSGRALVRRFHASQAGTYRLSGELSHASPNGDGVYAYVVVANADGSQPQQMAHWHAAHEQVATESEAILVEAGQTIDLIVLGGAHVTSDGFGWKATLHYQDADGNSRTFDSVKGFHGPSQTVTDVDKQVILAWRRILLREPSGEELQAVADWMHQVIALDEQAADDAQALEQALVSLCQTLMGSNEFLYVE